MLKYDKITFRSNPNNINAFLAYIGPQIESEHFDLCMIVCYIAG